MPDTDSTPPSRRSTWVTTASFAGCSLVLTVITAIRDDAPTVAAISIAAAVPLLIFSGFILWRDRRRRRNSAQG